MFFPSIPELAFELLGFLDCFRDSTFDMTPSSEGQF